jgi:SAM-dependent methyltransferase
VDVPVLRLARRRRLPRGARPRRPRLELGVGTGRVAIPLAERGVEVVGLDASARMLERLRTKTDRVRGIHGDMADVEADGAFELVYVVFNTLFALLTQDEQVRCFANVARRLAPDGAFVVEAFVPDPGRFDRGQRVQAISVGPDTLELEASVHDPVAQTVTTQKLLFGGGETELLPVQLRYAWPSELDLMARLAGLTLRERYASFERRPFTVTSGSHVSVYAR